MELAATLQALSERTGPSITRLVVVEAKNPQLAALLEALSKRTGPGITNLVRLNIKATELPALLEALSKRTGPSITNPVVSLLFLLQCHCLFRSVEMNYGLKPKLELV